MRRVDGFPLWIGTARDARDLKNVLSMGIEVVIDLALEEMPLHPTRELVYLRFPLLDGAGNSEWVLHAALAMLEECLRSKVPTLVACGAGMSRSPAVVAIAAAPSMGLKPKDVLLLIQKRGPIDVSPALWEELLSTRSAMGNGTT